MFNSKIEEEQSAEDAEDGPPELLVSGMLKNNGFTVLATVEIRGKNIFVYTISTMMHSKLDLKRVKKNIVNI